MRQCAENRGFTIEPGVTKLEENPAPNIRFCVTLPRRLPTSTEPAGIPVEVVDDIVETIEARESSPVSGCQETVARTQASKPEASIDLATNATSGIGDSTMPIDAAAKSANLEQRVRGMLAVAPAVPEQHDAHRLMRCVVQASEGDWGQRECAKELGYEDARNARGVWEWIRHHAAKRAHLTHEEWREYKRVLLIDLIDAQKKRGTRSPAVRT